MNDPLFLAHKNAKEFSVFWVFWSESKVDQVRYNIARLPR